MPRQRWETRWGGYRTSSIPYLASDYQWNKTVYICGYLTYVKELVASQVAESPAGVYGFRLGAGQNAWSNIHIHDLSDQILAEAATNQRSGLGNDNGIYCLENGKMIMNPPCN